MNKNIVMLAKLYDSAAADLLNALNTQTVLLNDERIRDKVRWLGEISKTLFNVIQIENLRAKNNNANINPNPNAHPNPAANTAPKENTNETTHKNPTITPIVIPSEQVVVDPALKKAQKQQFKPNDTKDDLSGFYSPGGWTP